MPGVGQAQKIFSVARQSDGRMSLLCGGAAGQTYIVQANSNPGSAGWTPVVTNSTDASGWMTCIDPTSMNAPARYYRTCVSAP